QALDDPPQPVPVDVPGRGLCAEQVERGDGGEVVEPDVRVDLLRRRRADVGGRRDADAGLAAQDLLDVVLVHGADDHEDAAAGELSRAARATRMAWRNVR